MVLVVSVGLGWVLSHGLSRADPTSTVPNQEKKVSKLLNLYMYWNMHQNNGMKNWRMFYYVMVFLLMMLINVYIKSEKWWTSIYVYMWMTWWFLVHAMI